jgi:hypothetical protein
MAPIRISGRIKKPLYRLETSLRGIIGSEIGCFKSLRFGQSNGRGKGVLKIRQKELGRPWVDNVKK